MSKRSISFVLCVVLCLSFSVMSLAEDDRIPEAGDHIFFGHYEQDNDLKNEPEPIEWRVLEVKGDEMLLLSEYILDAQPFNDADGGNQWNNSTLREWLNKEFMEAAFSAEEATAILLTEIDNSAAQVYYFGPGSPNTEDHVFLLSYAEVANYYKTPDDARGKTTNYAKPKILEYYEANSFTSGMRSTGTYLGKRTYGDQEYDPWWFRSPGGNNWHKTTCSFSGKGGNDYTSTWRKNTLHCDKVLCQSCMGIRPAMWININQYLELLPEPEPELSAEELQVITCDESITSNTTLGDTAWKIWLPDGFIGDELTEADIADNYIGYYLRNDDVIALQYFDQPLSLLEWQKELNDRGFVVEGLYQINGSESVIYRNEEADTITASVLDGKGKLLEMTFYPYSTLSDEADLVISSIQQETSKRRFSGAAGTSQQTTSSTGTANTPAVSAVSQEEAYQAMLDAYKAGKYSDSYGYYEQAAGFKDADKYGNLLKARLCYTLKLTDSEIESLEEAIANDIGFADSKDVLVCNSAMAHYYLLGYWKTSNGMHGYEVKENGGSTTTVPAIPRAGDYYTILNGTYWSYFDGKWDDRIAEYKFTPISKNKMEMYSYQAKQSYTFTKIR